MNYFSFANILLVEVYIKIRAEVNNILLTGVSVCYMQYLNTNHYGMRIFKSDIYYPSNCIHICVLIQNITKFIFY